MVLEDLEEMVVPEETEEEMISTTTRSVVVEMVEMEEMVVPEETAEMGLLELLNNCT